jgi:hypothetical protein
LVKKYKKHSRVQVGYIPPPIEVKKEEKKADAIEIKKQDSKTEDIKKEELK